MELTAENVHRIFLDCLYQPDGDGDNACLAEGVMTQVRFQAHRLDAHREEIAELLAQLPTEFQPSGGGGWSFMNACITNEGQQWGEHQNVDELLCLGLASGQAAYLMPRHFWRNFPGGMPYFSVRKRL